MKKSTLLCVAVLLLAVFAGNLFGQDAFSNVELRSKMTFAGQKLANICGWTSPDGQEYALVGANQGLIIVSVTDPDNPVQIVQIPGPVNDWKEIKTYRHFAYVTSEGGQGLQIVDMSKLPSATLSSKFYTGDGEILGQLNRVHALHIDTTLGNVYLFGSDMQGKNGAVVLDIHTDPYNPKYLGGYYAGGYVHDGYVDNDILYAGHIYAGTLTVVDMKDKKNPVVLGSTLTPLKFTHNAWLTDDHQNVLVTDERSGSYLASFTCSDPGDMQELDRLQTTPGSGSIVHNTHIYNDFAISSWYTDGFNIVDAHRPQNLVQTGYLDTWAGTGGSFNGCWGVFPYFEKSKTIVASNIDPAEIFICSPTYVRAAYLEGKITNSCTGEALSGVSVKINGGDQLEPKISKINGNYYTGQTKTGTYTATFSKTGYPTVTKTIQLEAGKVTALDVEMGGTTYTITGKVVDGTTGLPVANAPVGFSGPAGTINLTTNANGEFTLDCLLAGSYSAAAGAWGYVISQNIQVDGNKNVTLQVVPGYYDDFTLDYGWTTAATAPRGLWTRGEPVGTTTQNGVAVNSDTDSPNDGNDQCYITGNGGGAASDDDVDNGSVTLTTPPMKLSTWGNAELTFDYWFTNFQVQGNAPNDKFTVEVSNGTETKTIFTETVSQSQWRSAKVLLGDFVKLNDQVQVIFTTADDNPGNWVEAGVDVFKVVNVPVSTKNLTDAASLEVFPNPTAGGFNLKYEFENGKNLRVRATNLTGQTIFEKELADSKGQVFLGENWQAGVYFLHLESENAASRAVRLVKN